jgi:pyruvate dehydrogenase E1 component alpha subunit
MHVMGVYEVVREVAGRMRETPGPEFLVFDTYRFEGHHTADKQSYRGDDEVLEEFRHRDPIHILEAEMIDDHTVDLDTTIAYRDRIRLEVEQAFATALAAPWPEPDEALVGAYAEGVG